MTGAGPEWLACPAHRYLPGACVAEAAIESAASPHEDDGAECQTKAHVFLQVAWPQAL